MSRLRLSSAEIRHVGALCSLIASVCGAPISASAQMQQPTPRLRLPHMLSDHAVLQRDRPIHIWGWDEPSASITIDFRKQHVTAKADELGAWSAYLNPEAAGGPDTLTIHGTGTGTTGDITLRDILVGDVWFASGQSNMEIPLRGFPGSAVIKNADQLIAAANQPETCGQIRLLRFEKKSTDYPLDDQPASWTECNSATATEFSAVAYLFGLDIHQRERIPIGLVDSTWGGTPISSWLSLDALAADNSFMPLFAARARFAALQTSLIARQAYEQRAIAAAKAANQPAPQFMWHPFQASWEPAFLFNGMIAPATPYTIRGFLWYQGETDSNPSNQTPQLYHRLLPAMIRDWRSRWNEGDLPFLFVQISSFYSPNEDWGAIRDAQRQTLSVTNTAMAVSLDVGLHDNVHPPDKQTVAARLALGARDLVYGEHVEDSGPLPLSVDREPGGLRIWFSHAHGLHSQGGTVHGFEVASHDGNFQAADATIEGTSVLVHTTLTGPLSVRYAWASFTDANLYNSANLPASTFQWPEPN